MFDLRLLSNFRIDIRHRLILVRLALWQNVIESYKIKITVFVKLLFKQLLKALSENNSMAVL